MSALLSFSFPKLYKRFDTILTVCSSGFKLLGANYIAKGYVRRFIFDTAKVSQLFCHQSYGI